MKNKKFRHVIAVALAASMVLSMSACGGQKSPAELNTEEMLSLIHI